MIKEALLRQRDSDLDIMVAQPREGTASDLTAWAAETNAGTVHMDGEVFTAGLLNSITVQDAASGGIEVFTASFGDTVQLPGDHEDGVATFVGCLVNDHRLLCILRRPDRSLEVCRPSAIETVTVTSVNGVDFSELKEDWALFFDTKNKTDERRRLRPRINSKPTKVRGGKSIPEPSDPGEDTEEGSDQDCDIMMAPAAVKEKKSRMKRIKKKRSKARNLLEETKKGSKQESKQGKKGSKQDTKFTCHCSDCAGKKDYFSPKTLVTHSRKDQEKRDQDAQEKRDQDAHENYDF
jgi:hypothetical protein